MQRIDELTGLRAVAVGMVVLAHAADSMPRGVASLIPGTTGFVGVQIFFVLSGYLITSILMREYATTGEISFWGFYRRRLLRITPAFYTLLLVIALLAVAGVIDASWQEIALSAAYLWNYAHMLHLDGSFASHPEGAWYVGHTWSLALEEQFYWAWPAAFLLISRRGAKYLLPAAILIVPLIRIASYFLEPDVRPQLNIMFHSGIDIILVGCFIAMHEDVLIARFRRIIDSGWCLSLVVFTVLVGVSVTQSRLGGLYIATYGATVGAALMGFLLLAIKRQPRHWFCRLLRTRPFMYVGLISFSLYLWQQVFVNPDMPIHVVFPLNIVAAVVMAALSYHFVELPFLRLKDRPARRAAAAGLQAAAD